jgi:Bacterial archaeo-eukaryotic release factor family 10
MMTRDEIRELASFQLDPDSKACALSFYFQPDPPRDRSHRSEAIVAKDVVKQALKSAAAQGKNGSLHADLDRVLEVASNMRGQARGKAVFACSAYKFWREYDLPLTLGGTKIYLQPRFQLKPLAALLGAQPVVCVAVVDRQRARFFDLRLDDLREKPALVHLLSRSSGNYGYNGYEAGHAERRVADEALQHFKAVADRLRTDLEKGTWDRLVIGCQDVNWGELESQLHPYTRQRVIGRFSADVASVSNEEIRDRAHPVLKGWIHDRGTAKAAQAIDFAKANGRGVTGLRRVLRALESGEVQSLFLNENYSAHAVECPHCGHLDAHMVSVCVTCGHRTHELNDVCDAIVPIAIRRDIELFYLKDHADLDRAGNIAALLRFRSDQSKAGKIAAAS